MPELPEVEVVRLFLQDKILHQTIQKIEILTPKSFIGNPKLVEGQKITKLTRVGKQLSIHLSNKYILLVHLKMTGQLILIPLSSKGVAKGQGVFMGHPTKDMLTQTLPNKSTRLIFSFKNFTLFFNDQRKFGWVKVFTPSSLAIFQSHLGLDLLNPNFTPNYLFSQLQRSRRAIKLVLLDQNFFAGIGNIYANDALFISKIHPSSISNHLTLKHCRLLHRNLIKIIKQSIQVGGSTTKDQKYLRPDGTPGKNQFNFKVYQKKEEPCPVCQTPIKFIKLGGRGTFFCPSCQVKL